MIGAAMAKKVLGGAVNAFEIAVDAARHVAWYVSHQVTGQPRDVND
jgi:hypothetical protein